MGSASFRRGSRRTRASSNSCAGSSAAAENPGPTAFRARSGTSRRPARRAARRAGGHATLLIQVAGLNLLTDPHWSERASPLSFAGPKARERAGIAFADLPEDRRGLLTHNHYDHLDLDTIARLWARDRPRIVAPLGNDASSAPTRTTSRSRRRIGGIGGLCRRRSRSTSNRPITGRRAA
jgi:hypothetical protein